MKQRKFYDVNASIGRMSFREEQIPYTVKSLADEMNYFRIQASLVFSNVSKDYSFVKGNDELLEHVAGSLDH